MKALVGAGGGPKGAWSAGVLKALAEAGVLDDVEEAFGVSVNAINLAFLAQEGPSGVAKLEELWSTTEDKHVRKGHFLGFPALWRGGLNSIEPLRGLLNRYLDYDKDWKWAFSAGAVNLGTAKMEYGRGLDWIMASSAHPIWFDPVCINGAWYTDGGVIDVTPVRRAVISGADEIIAVTHSARDGLKPWPYDRRPGLLERTWREMEIAMAARLDDDLIVPEGVTLHVIRPDEDLDVEMPHFRPEDSQRLLQEGYAAGKDFVGRSLFPQLG